MQVRFLAMAVVIWLAVFSQMTEAEGLKKDTTIGGIAFPKGTDVKFDPFDKTRSVALAKDQKIGDNTFLKDTIIVFSSGDKMEGIILVHDQEIQGIKFPRATAIEFDPADGKIKAAYLGRAKVIQGRQYNDGDVLIFNKKGMIIRKGEFFTF